MNRNTLKQILQELLENETGSKYDSLSEDIVLLEGLGLDSIDLVGLVVQIENRFKIKIDTAELRQVSTVGQILDLLENKVAAIPSSGAA